MLGLQARETELHCIAPKSCDPRVLFCYRHRKGERKILASHDNLSMPTPLNFLANSSTAEEYKYTMLQERIE